MMEMATCDDDQVLYFGKDKREKLSYRLEAKV
jgi:hypothetical protein